MEESNQTAASEVHSLPRLVVQIPAMNEAGTLAQVIKTIPLQIQGIGDIKVLVIDDGSTDGTAQIALEAGADVVAQFPRNRGLAAAFSAGIEYSLAMGADIIVNTDGDNQYPSPDIPKLVAPIINGEADVVLGDRKPGQLEHFSWLKQKLQRLGSGLIRMLTHNGVADATTGFRAMTRQVAINLEVISNYTYTLETIFQAWSKGFIFKSVEISARETDRHSRLMKSIPSYILKSARNILTFCTMYRPLQVFSLAGLVVLAVGLFLGLRYFWFQVISPDGSEHFAALIVGSICIIIGIFLMMLALLAEFMGVLRAMLEHLNVRIKRMELNHSCSGEQDTSLGLENIIEGVRIFTAGSASRGQDHAAD